MNFNRILVTIGFPAFIGIAYYFMDRSNRHLFEDVILCEDGLDVKQLNNSTFIKWSEIQNIEEFPTMKTHTSNSPDPDVNLGAGGVRLHIKDGKYFVIYRRISGFKELLTTVRGKVENA